MGNLIQDLRYGLRQLRLSPGFAVVAIMSLALGIGANTAIFQLLDAVRIRTLPVSCPQELAGIHLADLTGIRGSSVDPITFVGVAILLAAIGLAASYLPARRATMVDPIVALRYE